MDIFNFILAILQVLQPMKIETPENQQFLTIMTVREQFFSNFSWPNSIESVSLKPDFEALVKQTIASTKVELQTASVQEDTILLEGRQYTYKKLLFSNVFDFGDGDILFMNCCGHLEIEVPENRNVTFAILLAELTKRNPKEFNKENVHQIETHFSIEGHVASLTIIYYRKMSETEFTMSRTNFATSAKSGGVTHLLDEFRTGALLLLNFDGATKFNSYNLSWKYNTVSERALDEKTLPFSKLKYRVIDVMTTNLVMNGNYGEDRKLLVTTKWQNLDRWTFTGFGNYKTNVLKKMWLEDREKLVVAREIGFFENRGLLDAGKWLENGISISYDYIDWKLFATKFQKKIHLTFETQLVALVLSKDQFPIDNNILQYKVVHTYKNGIDQFLEQDLEDLYKKVPSKASSLGFGYSIDENGNGNTTVVSSETSGYVYTKFCDSIIPLTNMHFGVETDLFVNENVQLIFDGKDKDDKNTKFILFAAETSPETNNKSTSKYDGVIDSAIAQITKQRNFPKEFGVFDEYAIGCRQKIQSKVSRGEVIWTTKYFFVLALKKSGSSSKAIIDSKNNVNDNKQGSSATIPTPSDEAQDDVSHKAAGSGLQTSGSVVLSPKGENSDMSDKVEENLEKMDIQDESLYPLDGSSSFVDVASKPIAIASEEILDGPMQASTDTPEDSLNSNNKGGSKTSNFQKAPQNDLKETADKIAQSTDDKVVNDQRQENADAHETKKTLEVMLKIKEIESIIWTALRQIIVDETTMSGIKDEQPNQEIRVKLRTVCETRELSVYNVIPVEDITGLEFTDIGLLISKIRTIKSNRNFPLLCWANEVAVSFDEMKKIIFIAFDTLELEDLFISKLNAIRIERNPELQGHLLSESDEAKKQARLIVAGLAEHTQVVESPNPEFTSILLENLPDSGKDNIMSNIWQVIEHATDDASVSFEKKFFKATVCSVGIEFFRSEKKLTAVLVLHHGVSTDEEVEKILQNPQTNDPPESTDKNVAPNVNSPADQAKDRIEELEHCIWTALKEVIRKETQMLENGDSEPDDDIRQKLRDASRSTNLSGSSVIVIEDISDADNVEALIKRISDIKSAKSFALLCFADKVAVFFDIANERILIGFDLTDLLGSFVSKLSGIRGIENSQLLGHSLEASDKAQLHAQELVDKLANEGPQADLTSSQFTSILVDNVSVTGKDKLMHEVWQSIKVAEDRNSNLFKIIFLNAVKCSVGVELIKQEQNLMVVIVLDAAKEQFDEDTEMRKKLNQLDAGQPLPPANPPESEEFSEEDEEVQQIFETFAETPTINRPENKDKISEINVNSPSYSTSDSSQGEVKATEESPRSILRNGDYSSQFGAEPGNSAVDSFPSRPRELNTLHLVKEIDFQYFVEDKYLQEYKITRTKLMQAELDEYLSTDKNTNQDGNTPLDQKVQDNTFNRRALDSNFQLFVRYVAETQKKEYGKIPRMIPRQVNEKVYKGMLDLIYRKWKWTAVNESGTRISGFTNDAKHCVDVDEKGKKVFYDILGHYCSYFRTDASKLKTIYDVFKTCMDEFQHILQLQNGTMGYVPDVSVMYEFNYTKSAKKLFRRKESAETPEELGTSRIDAVIVVAYPRSNKVAVKATTNYSTASRPASPTRDRSPSPTGDRSPSPLKSI